jgi:hypothetical protein
MPDDESKRNTGSMHCLLAIAYLVIYLFPQLPLGHLSFARLFVPGPFQSDVSADVICVNITSIPYVISSLITFFCFCFLSFYKPTLSQFHSVKYLGKRRSLSQFNYIKHEEIRSGITNL